MKCFERKNNFEKNNYIASNLIQGELSDLQPFVSIVIPTYKRPGMLQEAINSVLNQQGYDNYEVIVLDNETDSNTETERVLSAYYQKNILYYKNEKNLGMTGNWNRAIELARGEWVTILHDDDLLFPQFLEEMIRTVTNNPQIAMLASGVYSGKDIRYKFDSGKNVIIKNTLANFILKNISPFPGILFRKDFALRLGGFDEDVYPCADYEFWVKYHMEYNSYILNKTLAFYRMTETNTTKHLFLNIINKSFEIKKEILLYIDNLSSLEKKALLAIGMRNIVCAYKIYITRDQFNKLKDELKIPGLLFNRNLFRLVNKLIKAYLCIKKDRQRFL